ncbi:MAG TPA: translocation/assembly module TamB domain-containing protein [Terracidiphilus sp.]|jgi:translocation and assembly module TamB|nr:translocation/assembly module TamB domain-containing protein [Terracidiphilus sp.]
MSAAHTLFHESSPEPTPPHRPRRRWGRIFAWIAGALALLLFMVAATVAALLNSARFHQYVLAKVENVASQNLNTQVTLENFAVHFSTLSLEVYGLTVHGAGPYQNPPILQLQHAEVGVRIVSVLHGKWYLSTVRLDHPVVQLLVDKNGVSNIPRPAPSNSKSNTTIFDLGIRHAVLDHGEVYLNAEAQALSADLHDVDFRAGFTPVYSVYSGTLQYTNGRVIYGTYRPFVHNFAARFGLSPTTFQLPQAEISSGSTNIFLAATATNLSAPVVQAKYDMTIDGAQMARLIGNPSIPEGMMHLRGSANYHEMANQPALQTVTLSGDLISPRLVVKTPTMQTAVANLAAHYSMAHGDARLIDLRAGLLGGEVTAQGTMTQLGGENPHSAFTASVRRISLAQAERLAGNQRAAPVALAGELNADATATWGRAIADIAAKVDANIHGSAAPKTAGAAQASAGAPSSVPVDSEIHATYAGARNEIALTQSYLRTPQTSLTMNGTVSRHSSLAIRLEAKDLREVATIAGMFSPPANGQQPLVLAGSATFDGNVQGSTSAPHLTGQLSASHLEVNGTSWKVFRAGVDASPSEAALKNAELDPEPKGHITLNASAALDKWAFSKTSSLSLELNASQMDIASLAKMAGQTLPVTGTLNTHVTAHGSVMNPVGTGNLTVTNASAYNEPIPSLRVTFGGTGDEAHADVDLRLPAGSVKSNVTVRPREKTYTAQLSSTGIAIDKLNTVQSRNMNATGVVELNASGHGSFDNPQLTASARIPSLTVQGQTVTNIALNATVANHAADATLESAALHTSIQAKAHVQLTGDYPADATLNTQGIPLQPVVEMFSPAQAESLTGQTEVHATVHGPLKNMAALEAHVTIPYLKVDYNNTIQLASAAPIQADYRNRMLTLQHGAIRGTDTDIEFQGSIPVGVQAPMSLLLHGNVNLALIQLFDPTARTSGEVRFNVNSSGTEPGKNLAGEIDIVNASYAAGNLPVGLTNGNGVLTLSTDRLDIKSFQGKVGGGQVIASGGVAFRPAMRFNLGVEAKDVRMLYPAGMRESVNANIRLGGSPDSAVLGGTVDLTDLSFTPAFDLASFVGQFSSGVQAPPSMGIMQNIRLNLNVHSTNNVNLVSRTLSVDGTANLQVRGTAADPVILGRVDLTGGDMILSGNRYVLTGGTIQFVNPSVTQPVVNVTITTSIQQYNISMRFQGPTDQLNTQYTSDPSLPQADIIHLLAFGSTTEAPGTPATQQAEGAVASEVSSKITGRIAKAAGISQLSISPVLGNTATQGAGANITVQQRVTGNLFVTFSTNTANTQSEVIQGQYRISPKVSLSATRDPNGGFAVDTLIKKTY